MERDFECFLYSELKSVPPLNNTYDATIEGKDEVDVPLHSQIYKSRHVIDIKKESQISNGYFDIAIIDDEIIENDDLKLFVAIELKHNNKFNAKSVRDDIINLMLGNNKVEYGFMFNFCYAEKETIDEKKEQIFKEKLEMELNFKSKTKVFYYYVEVDYDHPEHKTVLVYLIKKLGDELSMKQIFSKIDKEKIHLSELSIKDYIEE